MNILISFDEINSQESYISAALISIKKDDPDVFFNLILKKDLKNEKIDLKCSDFEEVKDILEIIKLPYMPILNPQEIVQIMNQEEILTFVGPDDD